jgi:hypothetical protein
MHSGPFKKQLLIKCPNEKCLGGQFAVFMSDYTKQRRRITCPHCGEEHVYETHTLLKTNYKRSEREYQVAGERDQRKWLKIERKGSTISLLTGGWLETFSSMVQELRRVPRPLTASKLGLRKLKIPLDIVHPLFLGEGFGNLILLV